MFHPAGSRVLLSPFLLSILLFLAMVGVVNDWLVFHPCLLLERA